MRLYLDQMLRAELAEFLQLQGHDVLRAAETGQARADDALILERAVQERRILITLDEHFGDWAVLPLSEHFGVVRVKAHPPSTENIAGILLSLFSKRTQTDFRNRLVMCRQIAHGGFGHPLTADRILFCIRLNYFFQFRA